MAQPASPRRRALRLTGVVIATGALVAPLAMSAVAVPGMPSQSERDAASAAVSSQEGRVAAIEGQLADADARVAAAEMEASIAAEAYNTAQVEADAAQADYDAAASEKAEADAELEAALDDFAAMALDMYHSGGSLAATQVWVGADGFEDVLRRTAAYEIASVQVDDVVADSDAAQRRADRASAEADRTKTVLDQRLARADEAATAADAAVAEALDAQSALDSLMSSAVVELAALRQHSVDVERRYQEGLLEQRRQAEAAAQEQARQDEASRAGSAQGSTGGSSNGSGSGNDGGTTSEGGGSSSGGSNPAPAPTSDPAPAPQPTKTAAPQPTPTPTQTQPPAPKPTPPPAPPAPSRTGQAFVDMALSQVGKPYVLGAAGPNSYDCSGLVQWSLKQLGVSIPRTSRDQWWATTRVSEADLQPGDLIFYSSNGSASGIYHVAIYTGSGMRVHAPSPGKTVEHVKIWNTNIIGYGRVL